MTEEQILNVLAEVNVTEIDVDLETEEGTITLPVILYTEETIKEARRPSLSDDAFVIGYVKGSENPIYVNKVNEALPVYIAIKQDAAWDGIQLFPSLQEMLAE
jgi:hypothetical protein